MTTEPPFTPPGPRPEFDYTIVLCTDFDAVLRGDGQSTTADQVPGVALEAGRLLLQARGGGGKTHKLGLIAAAARSRGLRVYEVSALAWTSRLPDRTEHTVREVMECLLTYVGSETTPTRAITSEQALFLVDGLNEIRRPMAPLAVEALDLLAVRHPTVGVIATDRLVRRELPSRDWRLATLSPVSPSGVRAVLGAEQPTDGAGLYSIPFYLEQKRRNPGLPTTSAQHNREFLTSHAVDAATIPDLAQAALTEYRERHDRLIDLDRLRTNVDPEAVESLISAKVLKYVDEHLYAFEHHLLHDYLASFALADRPDLWNRDQFDALTLNASSFDALAMLLEQTSQTLIELLLRRVYDWNFYASAYLLSEDGRESHRVSHEMEVALTAMLAERRFDRLPATARRVSDALTVMQSNLAGRFRAAQDLSEVISIVAQERSISRWFIEWREFFARPIGQYAQPEDLQKLNDSDGLLGWTVSNVLRRCNIELIAAEVRERAKGSNPTVRWRAVHVLGAHWEPANLTLLMDVLREDDDVWVKYGAIRGLVELAASSPLESREAIFADLGDLVGVLTADHRLLDEVERALELSDPPRDWAESAGTLIEKLWAHSETVTAQDRWRNLSARLRLGIER